MALDRLSQITSSGISTTISFRAAGINVSGIVTATTFVGALTGNASSATIATYTSEWILGANGSSDYTFTGPGFTGAENDPVLYLVRGQQYKFTNTMGAHPFRIQSTVNGSTGTQYNDGITNNDVSNGTLTWDVQFDAPNLLYYQCTSHGNMGGKIYILNSEDNVSAGTTSAPSISPSGDSNTGIFFPAADTIAFAEGGAEAMRIDSSSRLLVGTSSARGNLFNTTATAQLQLEGTTNDTSTTCLVQNNSAATDGPRLVLGKSNGSAAGSNTIVASGHGLGIISFQGNDASEFVEAASIKAVVDATPGANDMPGRLVFSTTADGASSPTERMRIDNGGAVSIGTTGAPGFTVFGVAFGRAGNTGMLEQSRNVSGSTAAAAFGGNAGVVYVMGDGDLENTNNRYTGISDIKFKQNIEDASSQWDDIKSIQVRKYELIANPDRKHIGCVAQELEQVCPGLVIEREDQEGEPYKSVAYSVLYMKAVKALQEAIGRIETLEGMVAVNNITIDEQQHQLSTLAARLTALESA